MGVSGLQPAGRRVRASSRAGAFGLAFLVVAAFGTPALTTLPDFAGGQIPTLAPLLRQVTPAVVNIAVRGEIKEDNPLVRDPVFQQFDLPRQFVREVQATGSGVIVDGKRGYVLTNNHLIEHAAAIQVTTKDNRRFMARLVGRDRRSDIAILRIEGDSSLPSLPFGDSDKLEVGDFVLAIGNPFGLGQTVTSGIISALGRNSPGTDGREDFIQTDASINPGNSGGALIDLRGRLIGINAAILSPDGGNVGIGFAIPINRARRAMEKIIR